MMRPEGGTNGCSRRNKQGSTHPPTWTGPVPMFLRCWFRHHGTVIGTGALRVGGEFLAAHHPGPKVVYVPNPTWGNHKAVFGKSGLQVGRHDDGPALRHRHVGTHMTSCKRTKWPAHTHRLRVY